MSVKMKFGSKDIPFVYKGDKLVYPNPIKDGLLLWYDFKGMRNTDTNKEIAKDLSGNGNDGTLTNFNFTEESGYKDNTLVFDGVDDNLTIPELVLDKTSMSVMQDEKVYSYEDDKVLAIKDYSDKELTYLESLRAEGRNLIRGSEFKEQTSHYTYQRVDTEFSEGTLRATNHLGTSTTYPRILYRPLGDLEVGQQYTISFKAKSGGEPFSADFWVSAASGGSRQITPQRPHYTEQWKKYEYTITINENFSDATCIQWWVNATNPDTFQTLYLKEIQLEKGATSTDWSPAPEDMREKLPGVEVGGRNYLRNSDFSKGMDEYWARMNSSPQENFIIGDGLLTVISNPDSKSDFGRTRFLQENNLEEQEYITISSLIKGTGSLTVRFGGINMSTKSIDNDDFKRVVFVIPRANFGNGNLIIGISSGELTFNRIKAETGSKATEWTPSPEDFQTTSLSPSSLSNLQLYNRPLRKDELLHNTESKGLKELVDGVIVQDGLVLHYDFSHESNTSEYKEKAFDYSGNGNHGVLNNFNFTEESGYVGNKLKFDGVDDLITGNTELPSSNEFTLEIFMTAGTGFGGVTKGNYGAWASNEWGFRDLDSSHQFYYSNGDKSVGVNFLRREGKLSHYICILNENDLTVYLNGTEITSIPRNGDLRPTQQKLEVGRAYSGATLANHDYHSIKFYNRALTPEEIQHNYAIEKEKFNITEGEM